MQSDSNLHYAHRDDYLSPKAEVVHLSTEIMVATAPPGGNPGGQIDPGDPFEEEMYEDETFE